MHGGGPKAVPGIALPEEYTKENLGLLEKGLANMIHHIGTIRKSGMNPVVCINVFSHTDTEEEIKMVKKPRKMLEQDALLPATGCQAAKELLSLLDAVIDA